MSTEEYGQLIDADAPGDYELQEQDRRKDDFLKHLDDGNLLRGSLANTINWEVANRHGILAVLDSTGGNVVSNDEVQGLPNTVSVVEPDRGGTLEGAQDIIRSQENFDVGFIGFPRESTLDDTTQVTSEIYAKRLNTGGQMYVDLRAAGTNRVSAEAWAEEMRKQGALIDINKRGMVKIVKPIPESQK